MLEIYGKMVDETQGFDLYKGATLVEHFTDYPSADKALKKQGHGYLAYKLAFCDRKDWVRKPTGFKAKPVRPLPEREVE